MKGGLYAGVLGVEVVVGSYFFLDLSGLGIGCVEVPQQDDDWLAAGGTCDGGVGLGVDVANDALSY